nr:hypothetical protein [uncultured Methanoregula sp.]
MNRILPEYRLFILLALGVFCTTLVLGSQIWYLNGILAAILLLVLLFTRTRPDRGFYIVCSGVPLAIVCGLLNLWAGLFVLCVLAGIVSTVLGLFASEKDKRQFGIFLGAAVLITLLIQFSNHVPGPLLVLGIAIGAILLVHSVRMYQFRKQYTGA